MTILDVLVVAISIISFGGTVFFLQVILESDVILKERRDREGKE